MRLAFLADSNRQKGWDTGATPILRLFTDEIHLLALEYQQEVADDLRVLIVSSQYGLVHQDVKVNLYGTALNYERVDRQLPAYQRQWAKSGPLWLEGVDDVFIGLQNAHLYVVQRLGLMITLPKVVKRIVVGNVAPAAQFLRWADRPLRKRENDDETSVLGVDLGQDA